MSPKKRECGVDLGLTEGEKAELHRIARSAIEKKCRGISPDPLEPATEKLKEKLGAFVTLYKKGMLRGCIGSLEGTNPLCKTVEEMAQAAAFRDPRFQPLGAEELPYIELEISVLTPFKEIDDPSEIQVGVHGILIRKSYWSGLLLPQVASERGWDNITFLEETCRKAGLPKDAWRDRDTRIYVFSADVF